MGTPKLCSSLADCTDLILVCCHATYIGDGTSTAEDQWLLQDFQRSNPATGKRGDHETFIAHVLAGALAAQQNSHALLIFSGGQTAHSTVSEARGYHNLLSSLGAAYSDVVERVAAEECATDSYQNLLFSIIKFHEICGSWPATVTVITHAFKERRFLDLHSKAIQWPLHRIRVQGINPPFTLEELARTQESELERAYRLFERDPYGTRSPLVNKRKARGWDPWTPNAETLISSGSEDYAAVERLLQWSGGSTGCEIVPWRLPWAASA